jgi:endonuclease I
MTDNNRDDDLARRFKAVFNKDPISGRQIQSLQSQGRRQSWKLERGEPFDVDDEEVIPMYMLTNSWGSWWKRVLRWTRMMQRK